MKLNKRIPPEMLHDASPSIDDPARLADTIVAHLSLKLERQAGLLETDRPAEAAREALRAACRPRSRSSQVEKKIRTRVKKQMEKTQKEYYLNEQMQAIQKELGEKRRVQERDPGARGEDQDQEDVEGGARQGPTRSSRSSR